MDPQKMLSQMIDFQKTLFNGSFNAMTMAQTRTGNVMEMFLDQSFWVSEKWKDAISDWTSACQESFETVQKAAEYNWTKMEERIPKND